MHCNARGLGFVAIIGLVLFSACTARATLYQLNDDNSSLFVDTTIQATVYNWTVDGVSMLKEFSNWWRIGTNQETPLYLRPLTTQTQTGPNQLLLRYSIPGGSVAVSYTIDGGPLLSGICHDMGESVAITNNTSQDMFFHFYEYIDLDLTNTAFDDNSHLILPNQPVQTDGINTATGNVFDADKYEIAFVPTTLNTLNNALDLSNTTVGGTGDVAWGFQWDFDGTGIHMPIPAHTTVTIIKHFELQRIVPEPAGITLAAIGAVAALLCSRRRKWTG